MPIGIANLPDWVFDDFIDRRRGIVWTDATDMAAGGTGTGETLFNTAYRTPDAGRTLGGWRSIDCPTILAVAESVGGIFSLQGSNFKFRPQENMGNTGASTLLEGTSQLSLSNFAEMYAPIAGGETWTLGYEPIDAIAGNHRVGDEFTYTNIRLPLVPVIYSEFARETAVSAAGITAGAALNINNAHKLLEAGGIFLPAAHTVDEEANITIVLKCTTLPIQTITMMCEPVAPVVNATIDQGEMHAYLTRREERMPFSADRTTVNVDYDLDVVLTNAGQAAHYIKWI